MRGLTDEEREVLERNVRIGAGRYEYAGPIQSRPEAYELLVLRGCLRCWVEVSLFTKRTNYDPTPLGELALRADAAARALGLWPQCPS